MRTINHKTAFFSFPIIQFYNEMIPVAKFFKKKGWNVFVVFGWESCFTEKIIPSLELLGFNVLKLPKHLITKGFPIDKENKNFHKKSNFLSGLVDIYEIYKRNKLSKNFARTVLQEISPDIIFQGPFWGNSLDQAIILEAKKTKIKSCHLPVFSGIGETHLGHQLRYNTRKLNKSFTSKVLNKLFILFFPKFVRFYKNTPLVPFHPIKLIIDFFMDNFEKNPWNIPSRNFDLYLVELEFVRSILIDEKYDRDKIKVVGKPSLDEVFLKVHEKTKINIFKKYNIEINEGFILAYYAPNAEHLLVSWKQHELSLKKYLKILNNLNKKILLSLHPACAKNFYLKIVKSFKNVEVVLEQRLVDLYPFSLFVILPAPSTTNELAMFFDKPLIMYDVVNLSKDPEYPDLASIAIRSACENGGIIVYNEEQLDNSLKNTLKKINNIKSKSKIKKIKNKSFTRNVYKEVMEIL